jgi:hypothetical protein
MGISGAHHAHTGGVVEWSIAPVLKTGEPKGSVGSNPTPSAILSLSKAKAYMGKPNGNHGLSNARSCAPNRTKTQE